MNKIIIICEGQAEQQFCKEVLYPYFLARGVQILYPVISLSNGGIVKWEVLKREIIEYLHRNNNRNTYVTTFIDYYGLNGFNFPGYEINENVNTRRNIVNRICENISREVSSYRFIPYIQLHEFETLIFTDINVLKEWYPEDEILDFEYLEDTVRRQPDIELINDSRHTAPSKRLKRAIPTYDKVTFGNILLLAIGLQRLRDANSNFNEWITKLENIRWN